MKKIKGEVDDKKDEENEEKEGVTDEDENMNKHE